MESFLLQLVITLVAGGALWGAIRADIKNMHVKIEEEKRLREEHAKQDDKSFHDIRGDLQGHHGRISRMEGANDVGERIAAALMKAR